MVAGKIRDVCEVIDGIDPQSNTGKAISVFLTLRGNWRGRGLDLLGVMSRVDKKVKHMNDAAWHYLDEIMLDEGDNEVKAIGM